MVSIFILVSLSVILVAQSSAKILSSKFIISALLALAMLKHFEPLFATELGVQTYTPFVVNAKTATKKHGKK